MYKSLYDCFQHWYHNGTIWFYSDPHFNDEESKFFRTDYPGDDEQVKLINSKVTKNDTIIFLGDICDKEYVKKVRGHKVLILGNHDHGASYYKDYFDEVYEGCLLISDKLILSHEPVDFPYAFNIHGHVHGHYENDDRHFNVCAEHINYTPVCIKDIVGSGKLKNIPNIHREYIDRRNEEKQTLK